MKRKALLIILSFLFSFLVNQNPLAAMQTLGAMSYEDNKELVDSWHENAINVVNNTIKKAEIALQSDPEKLNLYKASLESQIYAINRYYSEVVNGEYYYGPISYGKLDEYMKENYSQSSGNVSNSSTDSNHGATGNNNYSTYDNYYITINSELMDFKPIILKNRALVPMRRIFEKLGASVSWDEDNEDNQVITFSKNDITIKIKINSTEVFKNDEKITIDQPPVLINGVTMVPIRFVSESLGAVVEYIEPDEYNNIFIKILGSDFYKKYVKH